MICGQWYVSLMFDQLKEMKIHSLLFLNVPCFGSGTRPWNRNVMPFFKSFFSTLFFHFFKILEEIIERTRMLRKGQEPFLKDLKQKFARKLTRIKTPWHLTRKNWILGSIYVSYVYYAISMLEIILHWGNFVKQKHCKRCKVEQLIFFLIGKQKLYIIHKLHLFAQRSILLQNLRQKRKKRKEVNAKFFFLIFTVFLDIYICISSRQEDI